MRQKTKLHPEVTFQTLIGAAHQDLLVCRILFLTLNHKKDEHPQNLLKSFLLYGIIIHYQIERSLHHQNGPSTINHDY